MPSKPLPPPEWYEEFRLLHVDYGRRIGARFTLMLDMWGDPRDRRRFYVGVSVPFEEAP